ncbi:MAG: hypothetical protein ISR65_01820 [Bacteriovoracaceae bacterium]|nr:hypothetical protein [Bacteriovoracaceae bacterium]
MQPLALSTILITLLTLSPLAHSEVLYTLADLKKELAAEEAAAKEKARSNPQGLPTKALDIYPDARLVMEMKEKFRRPKPTITDPIEGTTEVGLPANKCKKPTKSENYRPKYFANDDGSFTFIFPKLGKRVFEKQIVEMPVTAASGGPKKTIKVPRTVARYEYSIIDADSDPESVCKTMGLTTHTTPPVTMPISHYTNSSCGGYVTVNKKMDHNIGGCDLFVMGQQPDPRKGQLPAIAQVGGKFYSFKKKSIRTPFGVRSVVDYKKLKHFKLPGSPLWNLDFYGGGSFKIKLSQNQCEFIKAQGGHLHKKGWTVREYTKFSNHLLQVTSGTPREMKLTMMASIAHESSKWSKKIIKHIVCAYKDEKVKLKPSKRAKEFIDNKDGTTTIVEPRFGVGGESKFEEAFISNYSGNGSGYDLDGVCRLFGFKKYVSNDDRFSERDTQSPMVKLNHKGQFVGFEIWPPNRVLIESITCASKL